MQLITFAMRPGLSYAVLETDSSPALLGVVSASFAVPALALALPAGHLVDRIGERVSLVAGSIAVIAATAVALLSSGSLALLLLATALLGVGHLLSVVGEQALVANTAPHGTADSRFGLYTFAVSLGQTLGPLLLALPSGTGNTPPLGLVFAVCLGAAVLMLAVSSILRSSSRLPDTEHNGALGVVRTLLRTRGVPRALIAGSIVLSSVDVFLAYTPALGYERGLSVVIVSAMLAARSLLSMLSRLALGPLVGRFGRRVVLVSTVGVSAIVLAALALPLPAILFVVFAGLYGFAIGACQPITMSWLSELAPQGSRGMAMSLRLASNRIGQTTLPAGFGSLAGIAGAPGVLLVTALALVVAAWSGAAVGPPQRADQPPEEVL